MSTTRANNGRQMNLPARSGRTVSVGWVARQLGVTHQTVRRYIEGGRLDAYRLYNTAKYRVYYDSYVAFVSPITRPDR